MTRKYIRGGSAGKTFRGKGKEWNEMAWNGRRENGGGNLGN